MNLENLFNPKSIGIVGASGDEGSVGNIIAKNILTLGYAGEVILVNPKHAEVLGKKCYPSLFEVDQPVDLAIIAIPAKLVFSEIEKNADKIKNYVIISAGFSETSEEGKEREKAINKIAGEKGLNILGPNCLGFIIPELKLNASFAGGMPKVGNISFVTQSGALAVGMMDIAEKKEIGFSGLISIGNKMQVSESEILKYLANDEKTKVIGMYLEGIKNGPEFIKIASIVSRKKPIVVLKAGKTEKSQKAILSHTGALAGSDEIAAAVLEKCGIIRAENMGEFFDILDITSLTDPPKSDSAVVITNAGGPGVLTTDAFLEKDLKLADISEKVKNSFRKFLPEESSLSNPIDLLGDAREDRYDKALKIIGKDITVGSIISILTPQDQTPVAKIARKIINFKKKSDKNISTVFIGGKRIEKAIRKIKEAGIPNFEYPDQAVFALDLYYKWSMAASLRTPEAENYDSERTRTASQIIKKTIAQERKVLSFSEAAQITKGYGIKAVDFWEVGDNFDFSAVAYPAVLKIDSEKILHKTDKKGLTLGIKNKEEMQVALQKMKSGFPDEKLIVQPELTRETELILGIKKDPIFGPVIMYGLGGIYTEIFKLVDFLIPPVSWEKIKKNLLKSKIRFLFQETRGNNPYNLEEIAGIIHGLGWFAVENPQIMEVDVNPLLIYNDGKEAQAVDIKIIT
jgi:acetate---CoA ligase (ADP-forming)